MNTIRQESQPLNLVYFGSGAFGLPTLRSLASDRIDDFRLSVVVTQPDRPAGRGRQLTPTPIAPWMDENHREIPLIKTDNANASEIIAHLDELAPQPRALVVIAFGQKLRPVLLRETFAINLHASLLPKYRGAAPINHAMMNKESVTGVSVITLADRMDAGDILATETVEIQSDETAGELHDRLADLGPSAVGRTLRAFLNDDLHPIKQDESLATLAPKLRKSDGTVSFDQSAEQVHARIHGLNPWPGCTVILRKRRDEAGARENHVHDSKPQLVKLGLVRDFLDFNPDGADHQSPLTPGAVFESAEENGRLFVACRTGAIEILRIQPPGKRMMTFNDYLNAHPLQPGDVFGAKFDEQAP